MEPAKQIPVYPINLGRVIATIVLHNNSVSPPSKGINAYPIACKVFLKIKIQYNGKKHNEHQNKNSFAQSKT